MSDPTTPLQVYAMTADRDPADHEPVNVPIGGDGTPIAADPIFYSESYVTLMFKNTLGNKLWYLQSAVLDEGGDPKNAGDYTLSWAQIV